VGFASDSVVDRIMVVFQNKGTGLFIAVKIYGGGRRSLIIEYGFNLEKVDWMHLTQSIFYPTRKC